MLFIDFKKFKFFLNSMLVIENSRTLHFLHPMQFLDSAEWFDISSDDCYHQVKHFYLFFPALMVELKQHFFVTHI